ncbi:MAG: PAS domain S-box protein [Gemmataceae bacterium]|nr:PAS domain S-box protein [Gemmataceae bacterium]
MPSRGKSSTSTQQRCGSSAARDVVLQQTIGSLFRGKDTTAPLCARTALRQPNTFCDRADYLLRRHDGAWVPIRLSLTLLQSAPRPVSLLQVRDLPAQPSDVEDRLRASERKYRDLVETSNDLIWSIDIEGRFTYVNRNAAMAIFGLEPAEMIGRHFAEFVAPDFVARDLATHQTLQDRMLFQYETVVLHKDGSRVHLRLNSAPVTDDHGYFLGNTGTASNITKWKEAESALSEIQQRFEAFMNSIPLVGFMKDADGRMVYVNKEAEDRFALPAEHFLGKLDHDLWPKEVADALRAADLRVMADTERVELREQVPTPDGVLREWWVVKFPFRDAHGRNFLGGIALDLTERVQLEKALHHSEERYRHLCHRNLAGCFRITLDGRILECNDSFARMFGHSSGEEMCRRSTHDLYFNASVVRVEFMARLRENGFLTNYEMQLRRADGAAIWVLVNVNLLEEQGEKIQVGTVFDITQRKEIEEALRVSETNYRTLINHLDQGIFLKDREFRYVTVNPAFCKSVRRTEAELRGKTISDLFLDKAFTEKSRDIEKQVLAGSHSIDSEDIVQLGRRSHTVRINRTPVKDSEGAVVGVLGICWDVTEQRDLEAQLRHVQKMDAIGHLAGGIAHDFNNLLTIMLGNLSYVLAQKSVGASSMEFIRNAEKAGQRAAALTQKLLGFSHRATQPTVPFSLNQAIDEVVSLTRSSLPANIEVEVRTPPVAGPGRPGTDGPGIDEFDAQRPRCHA